MMNSRERVRKALKFEPTDRAPRDLWTTAAVPMFHQEELAAVLERYPPDIGLPTDPAGASVSTHNPAALEKSGAAAVFRYGAAETVKGVPYAQGSYTDEWGVVWEVGEDGVKGEVKQPLLADWRALDSFKVPRRIVDEANWDAVNAICAGTSKFMITPWHINLFERMQYLRGTELLLMDLAYGTPEAFRLRDMLHEFFLEEIAAWCRTDVDGIRFADDWGSQRALLISPDMWREYFKPFYAEYCRMIHGAGKFVFMHSDGDITAILPDLIEIGVDALNSQLFCMDIEAIAERYRGKIAFWGELDRQWILPYGTADEVREAVRRVRRALDRGKGGVIAQLEWGKDVPRANVETAFEAWCTA
jgi:hypothetical protein